MANLTPVAMSDELGVFEHVISLYNHVLPNIGKAFLRKYLSREKVHTILMLIPEDSQALLVKPNTISSTERAADKQSGNITADDAGIEVGAAADKPACHMPSQTYRDLGFGDGAEDKGSEDDNEARADETSGDESESEEEEAELDSSSHAFHDNETITPLLPELGRIVGALSFETMARYGNEIVQVSLLGVNIDYQKLGVGSRLLNALLRGEATSDRPTAAIAWADHNAVPFFQRHGFDNDAILCSRYRMISEPWERSILMATHLPPPVCCYFCLFVLNDACLFSTQAQRGEV